MKAKLNQKQKLMAYILNKDDDCGNIAMEKIGIIFNTSQSTISNAIKDISHQLEVNNLQKELSDAKEILRQHGLVSTEPIIPLNNMITVNPEDIK